MNYIISLSFFGVFVAALIFTVALTAFALLTLRMFHRRLAKEPLSIPVPPFIAAIATAWALSIGFVAADIWTINAKAENAAAQERSAIIRLAGSSRAGSLDKPLLKEALRNYAEASTRYEWQARSNSEPAPEVEEALQRIREMITGNELADVAPALLAKVVNDFDQLQDSRELRLGIGARSVNNYRWYLVFALTLLTLVSIAATHADRPAAGRNAILIFTTTAVVCIWILVLHANPYHGVEGIEPGEVNILPQAVALAS